MSSKAHENQQDCCHTSGEPSSARHIRDQRFNTGMGTERVPNEDLVFNFNLLMPYYDYPKEKRLFYTPFEWKADTSLVQHVEAQSFCVVKEVSALCDGIGALKQRFYQIQPDKKKIEGLRERIETFFSLSYKLIFCNKIQIEYSVEVNKLRQSLEALIPKIDAEREYVYEDKGEEILLPSNIQDTVYETYKSVLEPVIKENFVPAMTKLKKEFYVMEYLDGQHRNLNQNLDSLVKDINQTIRVVGTLKKKVEKATNLSALGSVEIQQFEKLKRPQELYDTFVELAVKIKVLRHDVSSFALLRNRFRKYLKVLTIMQVYATEEIKLKDLKRKLIAVHTKLQKYLLNQEVNVRDVMRRSKSSVSEADLPVELCKVDLQQIIESEHSLDQKMIDEMKGHIKSVENFTRVAELFCEEITLEKNQRKVSKINLDSVTYIEQIEKILKGVAFVKQTFEKLKPTVETGLYEEPNLKKLETEVLLDFENVTYEINKSKYAFDFESWEPLKLLLSLRLTLDNELKVKTIIKGDHKAFPWSNIKTVNQLAKIIRSRLNEKNKIYLTSRARVESSLTISDVVAFLQSKKFWQAIPSPVSHVVDIKGYTYDKKKLLDHKIYCNQDLEARLVRIIKSFIYGIADTPMKCIPC